MIDIDGLPPDAMVTMTKAELDDLLDAAYVQGREDEEAAYYDQDEGDYDPGLEEPLPEAEPVDYDGDLEEPQEDDHDY